MNEKELLNIIQKEGYKFITEPKTVFVPHGTEESELSHSLLLLRNNFKYMIQTEIT
jgi:hypothetical protein